MLKVSNVVKLCGVLLLDDAAGFAHVPLVEWRDLRRAIMTLFLPPYSVESCNQLVRSRELALWRYRFANVLELTLRRRRIGDSGNC